MTAGGAATAVASTSTNRPGAHATPHAAVAHLAATALALEGSFEIMLHFADGSIRRLPGDAACW